MDDKELALSARIIDEHGPFQVREAKSTRHRHLKYFVVRVGGNQDSPRLLASFYFHVDAYDFAAEKKNEWLDENNG